MLELVGLLAVMFIWVLMAGVTERKTGHKNYWVWPFILIYWIGLGRPNPVKQTEIDSDLASLSELSENIEKLNETIRSLIQKMEEREKKIQTQALKKAKQQTEEIVKD